MSACESLHTDPDPFAVGFAELRILALPGHVRGLALVMVDAVMSCEPDCFRAVRTVPSLTPISSAIIRIRLVELALKKPAASFGRERLHDRRRTRAAPATGSDSRRTTHRVRLRDILHARSFRYPPCPYLQPCRERRAELVIIAKSDQSIMVESRLGRHAHGIQNLVRQLHAGAKFQMPWRLLRPRAVELRPANENHGSHFEPRQQPDSVAHARAPRRRSRRPGHRGMAPQLSG